MKASKVKIIIIIIKGANKVVTNSVFFKETCGYIELSLEG